MSSSQAIKLVLGTRVTWPSREHPPAVVSEPVHRMRSEQGRAGSRAGVGGVPFNGENKGKTGFNKSGLPRPDGYY